MLAELESLTPNTSPAYLSRASVHVFLFIETSNFYIMLILCGKFLWNEGEGISDTLVSLAGVIKTKSLFST